MQGVEANALIVEEDGTGRINENRRDWSARWTDVPLARDDGKERKDRAREQAIDRVA